MKSITLVLCVIAILGAAASTYFYIQIGDKKEQLQQQVTTTEARANDLQAKLTESTAQADGLQKRLLSVDDERAAAVSKASAAETRGTQLNRDIAQLKNQITAKEDAEQALNREVSQLKRELAQSKLSASAATPEEIEGYKTNIATLQARITELEAGRGTVGTLPNTTGGTAAGSTTQVSPSSINAEVVSIGSQNAFVVLNAGSAQGVQVNQNFTLTRGGSTVATAQVSSVQDNFSIAQVAAGSIRGGLVKGDKAALTVPAAAPAPATAN